MSATGANAASVLQRKRLKAKAEQRSPAGLRVRRVVERPWQIVAGDIIGPLSRTSKGFEYILVLQDLCTRWVEASPIHKVKAKTIEGELNRRIFLRFGCPEIFVSDHGAAFTNHVVVDFLRERGVHHTHTPPYHIQATQVECAHRTLKAMVAPYLKERHTTWDEKLQELLFDMNTSTGAKRCFKCRTRSSTDVKLTPNVEFLAAPRSRPNTFFKKDKSWEESMSDAAL